ncbi:MAG: hypothetical protein H6728_16120 [Myxococcales bacterium]|nr:hypothetical protein [Myxococcales bacterium]
MQTLDTFSLAVNMSAFGLDVLKEVLGWLIGLSISAGVLWFLAHRELLGRTFFGRITFSYLGLEEDGDSLQITIDTMLDKHLSDVWLNNRVLLRSIVSCAQSCTDDAPIVIPEAHHLYHVKSGIRHQISERYSDGLVDRALGFEIHKEELLVALCFSASKPDGVKKLRALVVRPDILQKVGTQQEAFEKANAKQLHLVKTIQAIHKRWQEEKDQKKDQLITKVRIYRRK